MKIQFSLKPKAVLSIILSLSLSPITSYGSTRAAPGISTDIDRPGIIEVCRTKHGAQPSQALSDCIDKEVDKAEKNSIEKARLQGGRNKDNKCSDDLIKLRDRVDENLRKAQESCANASTVKDDSADSEKSNTGAYKRCIEKIKNCDEKKAEVNAIQADDEDQDTKNLINLGQGFMGAQSGMTMPSSLFSSKNEFDDVEIEYYNQCPQKTLKEHKEAKKVLEDKKDRLEKRKTDLEKDVREANKKAEEDFKKNQDDTQKAEEQIRDESRKMSERIADLQNERAKTFKEIEAADGQIRAQLKTKNNELIRRKKLVETHKRKLRNKHHFEMMCTAQYSEALAKNRKGPNTVSGVKGALYARTSKMEMIKECVSTEWNKIKLEYDLAKDELASAHSEVQYIRKQAGTLLEQRNQFEASYTRQEQEVRSNASSGESARRQFLQQRFQTLQASLQRQQQEIARMTSQIATTTQDIDKADRDVRRLGAEPVGESSIADARSKVNTAQEDLKKLLSKAESEGGECLKEIESSYREIASGFGETFNVEATRKTSSEPGDGRPPGQKQSKR